MTLRLSDPGELIATIPLMLGYTPVDSVVIVGLTRSGRMHPLMRADAAEFSISDCSRVMCSIAASHLSEAGAKRAIVVGYGGADNPDGTRAAIAAREALADHIDVVDAWAVIKDRYRSPECVDPECCPDAGRVIPRAPEGAVRAFSVRPHGESPAAKAPAERRRKARRAQQRSWAARERDPERWRTQRLEAWRRAVAAMCEGDTPSDAELGKIAAGLRDVVVRDAIVVDMVPGEGSVADALCVDPSAAGVREALAVMLLPASAVAPRPLMVAALEELASVLLWLCPEEIAPAMTLVGLARWWRGDESGAATAVAIALIDEPEYRLAELVKCAIDAHLPPGWLTAA
ncbi:DUF4192 domain-containing protein [Demequina sp. TTPB684]|uniref:DUF4192 domain-containing protein n=1 Tax=unclassified Demequina TaxID=2620311 RepID=UPI001CF39471|nr:MULTISPECIES: DUF4192 domain-containing protein [unclassified Demequina]MCB2413852.1 DUF4192 domain-containing protein [Demequina sp. TTPB684]UPU89164.1 DUF4192 domain-containing protein [Demequina sp. TMPB413]